ncbi:MAG: pyrimidine-nucleoside phosphorylase [Acholeplasmatales bacterium]|nr:pyrimidine-nucleoside phosphorylase [Acholeplasmatales bacterium]
MLMTDIIERKRDGYKLSKEEIEFFVKGYTEGSIPDYQASALCMAIYLKGMDDEEATALAIAMRDSGDKMDLSSIPGKKVDKHSTGGVGDKTSLVLAPLVASFGLKFAKMSGRGLGHTGGTLDKLESINGYNIGIAPEAFVNQVKNVGMAIVGQTGNLTPADKKLYALRDVTATVSSIPLIASSIMSKKLAAGADIIVLDVKVGAGAFMKTLDDARHLARLMVQIGSNCGRNMTAVLTNMEEPLGLAVGNALEVIEAINTLKGHGPKDLLDLCLEIGSYQLTDAGIFATREEAKAAMRENIANGKALAKFKEFVAAQGGDASFADDTTKFAQAKEILEVKADKAGYVSHIDALAIGHAGMLLGAGRETMADVIDPAVGIVLNKKVGDKVEKGEALCYVYTNGKNTKESMERAFNAFKISSEHTEPQLILDVIR